MKNNLFRALALLTLISINTPNQASDMQSMKTAVENASGSLLASYPAINTIFAATYGINAIYRVTNQTNGKFAVLKILILGSASAISAATAITKLSGCIHPVVASTALAISALDILFQEKIAAKSSPLFATIETGFRWAVALPVLAAVAMKFIK